MKTIIRKYSRADSDSIKEIFSQFVEYHAAFDDSFVKVRGHEKLFMDYIESNLTNETFNCTIAELDNKVIGYCVSKIEQKPPVYPNPTYGYIDNLCILEDYQRQGIGYKLVQDAIAWFKAKEVTRVECCVAIKNPKSSSFWRKVGFQPLMEQLYRQF